MARTQARGGQSLALLYDLEGGKLASGAEVNDHEIALTHDLGAQLFAEALRTRIRRLEALAVAQSTAFNIILTNLPNFAKLLGWWVHTSAASVASIDNVSLWLENPAGNSLLLWQWDSTTGSGVVARPGGTTDLILLPSAASSAHWPQRDLIFRGFNDDDSNFSNLTMRGITAAFGAGTINIRAEVLLALFSFPAIGALGSQPAAPLPSW